MGFFGLQALVAFVVIGWLPQVLIESGVSRGTAGLLLGLSVFSLALTVIALRARTGPFLFGLLHDVTHGWTVPFAMLIGVLLAQIAAGAVAGRSRYV